MRVIARDGVAAILATHVFGAPAPVDNVLALGAELDVPVLFDAAHAFGAHSHSRPVGTFGDVEVFSLSPTKPLVAGEGGLVSTNRDDIAEMVRLGRDYGNPGDYNTQFAGLNARMSELHGAVALESLAALDDNLATRSDLAGHYRSQIVALPGISPQHVPMADQSTWKDFTVSIDPSAFGVSRDIVAAALRAEGVDTRNYFDPPVHRQRGYACETQQQSCRVQTRWHLA